MGFFTECFMVGSSRQLTKTPPDKRKYVNVSPTKSQTPRTAAGTPSDLVGKGGCHARDSQNCKGVQEQVLRPGIGCTEVIGIDVEDDQHETRCAVSPPYSASSQGQQQLRDAMVLMSSPATITVVTDEGIVVHQNPQSKLYLGDRVGNGSDEDVLGLIFAMEPAKRMRMLEELSRQGCTGVWKAVVRVPRTLNHDLASPQDTVGGCLFSAGGATNESPPDLELAHSYISNVAPGDVRLSPHEDEGPNGERLTPTSTCGGGWPFGAEGRSTLPPDLLSNEDLCLSCGIPSSHRTTKQGVAAATASAAAGGASSSITSPGLGGRRALGDIASMTITEGQACLMLDVTPATSVSSLRGAALVAACSGGGAAITAATAAAAPSTVEPSEPSWLNRQRARTATGLINAGGGVTNSHRRVDSFTVSANGTGAVGPSGLRAASSRLLLAPQVARVDSNSRMGSWIVSAGLMEHGNGGGNNSFVQDPLATSTFATLVGNPPVTAPQRQSGTSVRSVPAPIVPSNPPSRTLDSSSAGNHISPAAAAAAAAAALNAATREASIRNLPRRTASCLSHYVSMESSGVRAGGGLAQCHGFPSMPAGPNASRALAFALSLGTSPLAPAQQQLGGTSPHGRAPAVGHRAASSTTVGHVIVTGASATSAAACFGNNWGARRGTMSLDLGGRVLGSKVMLPVAGNSATADAAFISGVWPVGAVDCDINRCGGGGGENMGIGSASGSFHGNRGTLDGGGDAPGAQQSHPAAQQKLRAQSSFPRVRSFMQPPTAQPLAGVAALASAAVAQVHPIDWHESEMASPFVSGPHIQAVLGIRDVSGGGAGNGAVTAAPEALPHAASSEGQTAPPILMSTQTAAAGGVMGVSRGVKCGPSSRLRSGSGVGSASWFSAAPAAPPADVADSTAAAGSATNATAATIAGHAATAAAAAPSAVSTMASSLQQQQGQQQQETQVGRKQVPQQQQSQLQQSLSQQSQPQQSQAQQLTASQGSMTDPFSSGGGNGVAAAATAVAEPECWHEVWATTAQDPVSCRDVIILTQMDVTAKVIAERHLALVMETEHRLVEQLFPRHILQYITEEWTSQNSPSASAATTANVATGGAAANGPAGSAPGLNAAGAKSATAAGNSGGDGGGDGGGAPTLGAGGGSLRWRPVVRDCNALATWHPEVTLLFADIKGFTPLCKQVEPRQVMALLNALYSRFDAMLDTFGVYKVETIGDCYFVAGGLIREDEDGMAAVRDRGSTEDPLHAERVFMFAKAMLAAAREVATPLSGEPVEIRIGIHTGPVVSGVVGTRMPRFCLFGDTVNTASRMESTGSPGAIHASQATYKRLRPNSQWECTGGIEVKGKGLMQTFLWRPTSADEALSLCFLRDGLSRGSGGQQAPATLRALGLEPAQEPASPLAPRPPLQPVGTAAAAASAVATETAAGNGHDTASMPGLMVTAGSSFDGFTTTVRQEERGLGVGAEGDSCNMGAAPAAAGVAANAGRTAAAGDDDRWDLTSALNSD